MRVDGLWESKSFSKAAQAKSTADGIFVLRARNLCGDIVDSWIDRTTPPVLIV